MRWSPSLCPVLRPTAPPRAADTQAIEAQAAELGLLSFPSLEGKLSFGLQDCGYFSRLLLG